MPFIDADAHTSLAADIPNYLPKLASGPVPASEEQVRTWSFPTSTRYLDMVYVTLTWCTFPIFRLDLLPSKKAFN